MRYAIIGDIHSNLSAFRAVLEDIGHQGKADKLWCLGDVVGYGPDPHECIELLQQTNHVCVAGNHDWAAISKISTTEFNPDAAAACRWTMKQLKPADVDYLGALPLSIEEGDFTLVHGSPREPIWEYVISISVAEENYAFFKTRFCLVGHSHVPLAFTKGKSGVLANQLPGYGVTLGRERLIINPGAVGQPRDGDPRASYIIYDSEAKTIKLYRVPYDIRATQDKMVADGLPMRLVARLSYGV